MSKFALLVATLLSAGSISAHAEEKMVVDMRKLTCAQLTRLGFQDFAGVTMWLAAITIRASATPLLTSNSTPVLRVK